MADVLENAPLNVGSSGTSINETEEVTTDTLGGRNSDLGFRSKIGGIGGRRFIIGLAVREFEDLVFIDEVNLFVGRTVGVVVGRVRRVRSPAMGGAAAFGDLDLIVLVGSRWAR